MPKRKELGLQGHSSTPGFPFSKDFIAWGIYVEIQMARHSVHLLGSRTGGTKAGATGSHTDWLITNRIHQQPGKGASI